MNLSTFGALMCSNLRGKLHAAERELCRNLNALGVICKSLGLDKKALEYLNESHKIYDQGSEILFTNLKDADTKKEVIMVEKNEEIRQWRLIQMVTSHHLRLLHLSALRKALILYFFRHSVAPELRDLSKSKSVVAGMHRGAPPASLQADGKYFLAFYNDGHKRFGPFPLDMGTILKNAKAAYGESSSSTPLSSPKKVRNCKPIEALMKFCGLFGLRKRCVKYVYLTTLLPDTGEGKKRAAHAIYSGDSGGQEQQSFEFPAPFPFSFEGLNEEEAIHGQNATIVFDTKGAGACEALNRLNLEPWLCLGLVSNAQLKDFMAKAEPEVKNAFERAVKMEERKRRQMGELLEVPLMNRQKQEELMNQYRTQVLPAYRVNGILPEVHALSAKYRGLKYSIPKDRKSKAAEIDRLEVVEVKLAKKKAALGRVIRAFDAFKALESYLDMCTTRSLSPEVEGSMVEVHKELRQHFTSVNQEIQSPSGINARYEWLFGRIVKHFKNRSKLLRSKVDEEYKNLDFRSKNKAKHYRTEWNLISDSLNVIRICKLLVGPEYVRLKKVEAEYNRARGKLISMCNECVADTLGGRRSSSSSSSSKRPRKRASHFQYMTLPQKKTMLESLVLSQREYAKKTARELQVMSMRFGIAQGAVMASSGGGKTESEGGSSQSTTVSESHKNVNDERDKCDICKHEYEQPTITKCGHQFCFECITAWARKKQNCPLCRQRVRIEELTLLKTDVEDSMTKYHENCDENKEIQDIQIEGRGDYGTKVETAMRYVKLIGSRDKLAKILIFSHFSRSLDAVAACLKKNAVGFVHLKGSSSRERSKLIENFKIDPAKKVMLMSLRSDSSGLTLVAASYVFLMEPSFNLAVEQQAINRVHRIGQKKACKVYRFVSQDTIEEQIWKATHVTREKKSVRQTRGKDGNLFNEKENALQKVTRMSEDNNDASSEDEERVMKQEKEELGVNQLLLLLDIHPNPSSRN
eukprot:CAMPEP_0184500994 /NCGR_PEP_ID=MMETSP0113_2-20130426/46387_1 /TAXON_ID=91329 /ORGANISM="Norrisiella sphaerica, Strain BC52" /LENGTH=975 /DNA_ID=CAMNT_0026889597 /DNA_START=253 /DNA_END=3180 /DNA_ORIENTATION=-